MSLDLAFANNQDWSGILGPYIKDLFKEFDLCYFGHVTYDASGHCDWMMSNAEWAQIYWLGGLDQDEPIYQDVQRLTKMNQQCIALWDCYSTEDNKREDDIMQRRMDVCKMHKGVTIGKQIGPNKHYISVGWEQSESGLLKPAHILQLRQKIDPLWRLHTQLIKESRGEPLSHQPQILK